MRPLYLVRLVLALSIAVAAAAERAGPRKASSARVAFLDGRGVSFPQVEFAPKIDGKPDDDCWKAVRGLRLNMRLEDGRVIPVSVKACGAGDAAYLLLVFRWPGARAPKSRRWRWNPAEKAYLLSGEDEPALAIIISNKAKSAEIADVWIWRFDRNNAVGFADDMWTLASSRWNSNPLRMDDGAPAWFSRYFAGYAGAELPRFYCATPSGSAGDVKGRSSLRNGTAVVELSRKFKTGHKDDVDLAGCSLSLFLVSTRAFLLDQTRAAGE